MHKRITFRKMQHSEVLEQYANQQLDKLEHFLLESERTPIYIDLVFEPSKIHSHHRVELRVKTPNYDLISNYEFEGTPFYEVVDRVIDVMYNEIHNAKKKIKVDDPKHKGFPENFKKGLFKKD